jgi:hypothetical protein
VWNVEQAQAEMLQKVKRGLIFAAAAVYFFFQSR